MRRTTICRSSRSGALLAAMLVAAAVQAPAQDTLTVEPDTMAAQPDTLALFQEAPRVHVVRIGETLWSLAEFYLGDPLLWPEIYRLNTLVVEDPHWIFPGEELRLAPPDTITVAEAPPEIVESPEDVPGAGEPPDLAPDEGPMPAPGLDAPAPPPPPPTTSETPTIFARNRLSAGPRRTARLVTRRYRAVGAARFYSSGFLTENERLPWASVLGAVDRPTLGPLTASSSATIFREVTVRAPANATYAVGDSLLLAVLGREVQDGWGRVVRPTGVGVVTAASGRNVRAEVVTLFGRVTDGQVALPLEPFRQRTGEPVPIENGMRGEILAMRDVNPVANQQDIAFIDRGRSHGVVPGDVFEVLRPMEGDEAVNAEPRQVAIMQIVHVRERSASGFVIQVADLGTRPGAPVRLIRKMPS